MCRVWQKVMWPLLSGLISLITAFTSSSDFRYVVFIPDSSSVSSLHNNSNITSWMWLFQLKSILTHLFVYLFIIFSLFLSNSFMHYPVKQSTPAKTACFQWVYSVWIKDGIISVLTQTSCKSFKTKAITPPLFWEAFTLSFTATGSVEFVLSLN